MKSDTRSSRLIRRTVQGGLASLLVVAGLVTFSELAGANAANPDATTTATGTENLDGSVNVTLSGTWSWPGQSCEGRYGEGWTVDWWGISTSATPSPNFNLSNASIVDPPGTTTTGTISPAGSLAIHASPDFFHYSSFLNGETINDTGVTCTDTGSGGNVTSSGSWSAAATYPSAADIPPAICVNIYDLHGSEGKPGGANETDPSKNGDNSIQQNQYDPSNFPGTCTTVTVTPPDVNVVKTGPATGVAGDQGTYTMTATNSGEGAASGVVITDTLPTGETYVSSTNSFGTCTVAGPVVSCPVGTIAGSGGTASVTVTVSYGADTSGQTLTDCATVQEQANASCVPTTIPGNPAITLKKSANISSYDAAGTPVTYSYLVTNTGNVTLDPVVVTDPMSGLSAITCPHTSLAAGANETCTATYTTTQADVDAGHIHNVGTATGTPPFGPNVTATSPLTIPGEQNPAITLVKSASISSYSAPGASITYSYLVTNTGNVTLNPVVVTDPMTGLSAISCPHTKLAPNGSETCTATYTTTQADVDAGSIHNTGTATGTPPSGPNVVAHSSVTIPAVDTPAITLVKSANISSYNAPGTPVTYSYLVTNTGNVTLNPVVVTDPMPGLSAISCPDTSLAPEGSETCTATYTTTQADVDAGNLNNTGTATGKPPSGPNVVAHSSVTIPAVQTPAIALVKSASVSVIESVGAVVTYTYVVTNTGNVTLTHVVDSDPMPGLSAIDCPDNSLAPAESETCTATYIVTLADLLAGDLHNIGTATGTPPSGPPVTATSTVNIPVAAITLVKSADVTSVTALGTVITYSYLVTNTGTVTLDPVVVTDPMVGLSAITCPDTSLAPTATETCTATYTSTQADFTAGVITNTGTATGTPPSGPPVIATSTVTIPARNGAPNGGGSVTILKQVCGSTVAADCTAGGTGPWIASTTIASGSTAYWKITVTNTGGTALTGVAITDPLTAGCASQFGTISLAVGASDSIYCSSTDVTTGFTNVATATFTGQTGTPPASSAQVAIAAPAPTTPAALAFTGIESLGLKVFGGLALILLGLGLTLVGRRPRRSRHAHRS